MNVLLIGYDEALTNHIGAMLTAHKLDCHRISIAEAIDPNHLREKASWANKIILVTTDTFMGLGVDISNALEATTDIIDEILQEGGELIHINSTLALGRGDGTKDLTVDSDWTDNLDWNDQAYMLHRIDREFWRGVAEGMNGCSILLPVVEIDAEEDNVAKDKKQEYVSKRVFPTGSTGFLAGQNLAAFLLNLLHSEQYDDPRYLLVDENLTYLSWLSKVVQPGQEKIDLKPMAISKSGWSWINGLLGRSKGAKQGYSHVLSTALLYTSNE